MLKRSESRNSYDSDFDTLSITNLLWVQKGFSRYPTFEGLVIIERCRGAVAVPEVDGSLSDYVTKLGSEEAGRNGEAKRSQGKRSRKQKGDQVKVHF